MEAGPNNDFLLFCSPDNLILLSEADGTWMVHSLHVHRNMLEASSTPSMRLKKTNYRRWFTAL